MWPSLWSYAPTPEQLAFQQNKRDLEARIEALGQLIAKQRPEAEDEEKLRLLSAASLHAGDDSGTDDAPPTPLPSSRSSAHRKDDVRPSKACLIASQELEKELCECEKILHNFMIKINWNLLFPYDGPQRAQQKRELDILHRDLQVVRYTFISKVGPYRPLDPTLLFPAQIPSNLDPALSTRLSASKKEVQELDGGGGGGDDALLSAAAYKEEGPGVCSFNLLHPDFCDRLVYESNALAFWTQLVERRGICVAYRGFRSTSKNRRVTVPPGLNGVRLDPAVGSATFLNALVKQAIEPVVSAAAEKERRVRLSLHPSSAMAFSYSMDDIGMSDSSPNKPQRGLVIDICLGVDFTGANLLVIDHSNSRLSIPQIAGRAVVLNAENEMSTETITGGERYNLVIYCDVKEEPIRPQEEANQSAVEDKAAMFLGMPEHLMHHIMDYLSLNDLRSLTLTSFALHKLITERSTPFWERLCSGKYLRGQDEDWRIAFMNGHKALIVAKWREQERKREQKKLFHEGMTEGYFLFDFDRFEDDFPRSRRIPSSTNADEAGEAHVQIPYQVWTCCVLQ
jgi:hypothetical protein